MKKITLLLVLCLATTVISAKSISGIIMSKPVRGIAEPIPYTTVLWLEGKSAIAADEKGEFKLDIKNAKEGTIVASYLGYSRDTVTFNSTSGQILLELIPQGEIGAVVVKGAQEANYISRVAPIRTEVISAAGLCKMACCNLAESFENSASVSVGYSDAVTGAKQIRLLGLSGAYTTMLDENRPVMRGLAAPFGLSYVPGQWLESIQIAKGPSSVVNGLEAITGQINLEHRKPTTEQPLFVNLFLSSMLRTEVNLASSLQLNNKWSTVMLGHFSTDPMTHDGNNDGFRDEPNTLQVNFSNRWLYMGDDGTQVRFGFRALSDERIAGDMDFEEDMGRQSDIWGSIIKNKGLNGYVKVGIPLSEDNSKNIAIVGDYNYHQLESFFGMKEYNGYQNSAFFNAMFQSTLNDSHSYTLGVSAKYDDQDETLNDYWSLDNGANFDSNIGQNVGRNETSVGVYGEYTYTLGSKLTAIGGLRVDYSNKYDFLFVPRLNIKYSINDDLVFRVTGGRGFRTPNLISDNLGILSTGRQIYIEEDLDIEDAWTYGTNITQYFQLGAGEAFVSLDYFRSDFSSQVIVDQEYNSGRVSIYNLDGPSFTDSYQIDFSVEPFDRFTVATTFRYTNARVNLRGQGLVDTPLMSKYKGVLNLQYATNMNKWTFDFTAQLNGPSRLPDYAVGEDGELNSPIYPMLYGQITRKIGKVDLYVGAENILNYKQDNPILEAQNPFSQEFNSTAIWGPINGAKFYIGLRWTLWK